MPSSRTRRGKTAKKSTRTRAAAKPAYPTIIVFDVDGVLVDTRESFHRTAIETVRFFTKKPVTLREFHAWKNRPGFNDDWILCTTWVKELGFDVTFSQIKRKFQQFYWGKNGQGFVLGERWLLIPAALRRLGRRSELAIFTGRYYREMDYTLDRNKVRNLFTEIMTVERAKRPKPAPDGLLKILAGRDPSTALYLGDTIDDALAAKAAKVPFVGVLPRDGEERRQRGATLRRLGALTILGRVNELEDWLQKRFRP